MQCLRFFLVAGPCGDENRKKNARLVQWLLLATVGATMSGSTAKRAATVPVCMMFGGCKSSGSCVGSG